MQHEMQHENCAKQRWHYHKMLPLFFYDAPCLQNAQQHDQNILNGANCTIDYIIICAFLQIIINMVISLDE